MAVVLFNLTVQQSAQLFNDLNTSKRQTLWVRFKAATTFAGEPEYTIETLAKKYGLTLGSDTRNPDLCCAASLYEANQRQVLDPFLFVVAAFKAAGHPIKKSGIDIEFQRGLIDLLTLLGAAFYTKKANVKKMAAALTQVGPALIRQRAASNCPCARTTRGHYCQAMETILKQHQII